jgi:hypothetical protein
MIRNGLSQEDYARVATMVDHTGMHVNSYEQYRKWGTLCHPAYTVLHYALNWGFWFGTFFLIGGIPFAVAIFGMAGVWAIGVRTYNYDGHGGGKDKRQEGIDFNREDLSINQVWPGYVAGEWHNNHHLYPNGARSGFQRYQLDLPWLFVCLYRKLGGIASYRDYKEDFMRDHFEPWVAERAKSRIPEPVYRARLVSDSVDEPLVAPVKQHHSAGQSPLSEA